VAQILIADDDPSVRDALGRLLTAVGGHTVSLAATAAEAVDQLLASSFDLLVTDIQMPGNDRLQMIYEHASLFASVPVVVITAHPSLETAMEAVRLPIVDYVSKPLNPVEFLERAERALRRGRGSSAAAEPADGRGSSSALPPAELDQLSPREREILVEFGLGYKPSEIASRLHISPHTVRNHFKAIYQKLGVASQAELMHWLHAKR